MFPITRRGNIQSILLLMEHPFIFKRLLYGVKRNPTRVRKMERPADEDLQPTYSTTSPR